MASTYNLSSNVFEVFNNKSPKEGPRYAPIYLNFQTASSWGVDLMLLQQQGFMSSVQALFIDNSANTESVSIAMGIGGGQVIVLQAGQQGFVTTLLNNNPKFIVTSESGTTCNIFALNFPVINSVWNATSSASTNQDVNLTAIGGTSFALGQALMAGSLPVTLASDQTPITVTRTLFIEQQAGQNLTTSTTSAPATLAGKPTIRVVNIGTAIEYIRFGSGTQTAVVGDLALPPNGEIYLANPSGFTGFAAISSGAGLLNITEGEYGPS